MAVIGGTAVVPPTIFRGPLSERLLSPKAVTEVAGNRVKRGAASGQKQTVTIAFWALF